MFGFYCEAATGHTSVTLSPVEAEGVLGEDGGSGNAGSEAELGRVWLCSCDHQEGEELPPRPLHQLSIPLSQTGIGQ